MASLDALAFEGATKRSKPNLKVCILVQGLGSGGLGRYATNPSTEQNLLPGVYSPDMTSTGRDAGLRSSLLSEQRHGT